MNTNLSVTNKSWLSYATQKLKAAGIDSAGLDAIIILCFCLKLKKIDVLSNPSNKLTKNQVKLADKLLKLRVSNYPIGYITQNIEFYNRSFYIDKHVLIPRPESESFINLLKTVDLSNIKYLTDLGCGSGVLGITAKLEFPNLNIELLDKSINALKVTKKNLSLFRIKSVATLSDLLLSSDNKFDVLLANLPYVPNEMLVSRSVLFEPKMAVFSGHDGLDLYRRMLNEIKDLNHKPKFILIECLDQQVPVLDTLFNKIDYKPIKSEALVHMYLHTAKMLHSQS